MDENKIIKKRYKIVKKIGSGGVGTVYLATDIINKNKVAIKFLKNKKRNIKQLDVNRYRLMNEYKLLSQFNSDKIVKIYDYKFNVESTNPEDNFIVLEFIDGNTLKSIISKRLIGEIEILNIAKDVLKALSIIHKKKLIHRDIKPENIVITKSGKVKLLDFGIVYEKRKQDRINLTSEACLIGSLRYIAPEYFLKKVVSSQMDLYALGITIYQCVYGKFIYKNIDNPQDLFNLFCGKKTFNVFNIQTNITNGFGKIINKACNFNTKKRYKKAELFIEDINKYLESNKKIYKFKNIQKNYSSKNKINKSTTSYFYKIKKHFNKYFLIYFIVECILIIIIFIIVLWAFIK